MAETELEQVTRQRDEYWQRLLQIGRDLVRDEDKRDSRILEVERERDDALSRVQELEETIESLRRVSYAAKASLLDAQRQAADLAEKLDLERKRREAAEVRIRDEISRYHALKQLMRERNND